MHRRNRARSTNPVPELILREGSGKETAPAADPLGRSDSSGSDSRGSDSSGHGLSPVDEVAYGRNVIEEEVKALQQMIPLIGPGFCLAAQRVLECKGRVVVSGMGKAGLVGAKLAATLASTGTPSLSLHPAEAFHGDLGKLVKNDVLIVLSNSGETSEVLRLIPRIKQLGNPIIAITGNPESNLARFSDIVLFIGRVLEACPIGLAPTASTTAMLAMGDALAMTVARLRNFGPEEYAFYHPGGDLGRRLLKVHEIMRSATGVTVVPLALTARETLIRMNRTPRRPGAAAVVDDDGRLVGIFTDGDLARGLERTHGFLDLPVKEAMCTDPKTIGPNALVTEALNILRQHNIDQLPVVDEDRRPIGLVDVQDLMAVGMVSGY